MSAALTQMLDRLKAYLPPPAPPLPTPALSIARLVQRPAGVGGYRGSERRGALGLVVLKGLRLDATVRFQLWASTAIDADASLAGLGARVLADHEPLWQDGFLRLTLESAAPAEYVAANTAWKKEADFRVLFEHRYLDADGAQSLIAQIPIDTDPEQRGSPARETSTVTDEMVRWDDLAARPLIVRGPGVVAGLAALSYAASVAPAGAVTLTRTFDGASAAPAAYPALSAFVAAITAENAPERHGQVVVGSLPDFLAAFVSAGEPLALGDWDTDGNADEYESRWLGFGASLVLGRGDRLEIAYQHPALERVAVVYLRARKPESG